MKFFGIDETFQPNYVQKGLILLLLLHLNFHILSGQEGPRDDESGNDMTTEERTQILIEAEYIPRIYNFTPKYVLKVVFGAAPYFFQPTYAVPPNGTGTRPKTALQPIIAAFNGVEERHYYTLIMIGDIPTLLRGILQNQVLHWLVCNIPGNALLEGIAKAFYLFPTPVTPEVYYYKLLYYKQKDGKQATCISGAIVQVAELVTERLNFNASKYQIDNNLIGPLALQIFKCCEPFATLGLIPLLG